MPSETPERISLATPNIGGNELAYVRECLETGWVSSVGRYVDRFEQEFAAAVGAKHAVATVNGTAALHVALTLAGIGPDDQVIVPALTFIAPANAVRYCGALPVFVDVDPDTAQLDPVALDRYVVQHCVGTSTGIRDRRSGRKVTAMIAVDLLGHPANIPALARMAERYGLRIIEDATESLGALRHGAPVGSDARFACFSFNGNKLITTGGGGMLVTDDAEIARRAKYLTTQAKDDPVEFVHGEVGWNYRLTNIQAAIGCAQLEQLGAFVARKREIREAYAEGLADVRGVRLLKEASWAKSAMWLSTIVIDPEAARLSRRQLAAALEAEGIETRPLWQPLHRSPAHRQSPPNTCAVADRLQRDALSLPSSTHLTPGEQARVIAAVRRHLGAPAVAVPSAFVTAARA